MIARFLTLLVLLTTANLSYCQRGDSPRQVTVLLDRAIDFVLRPGEKQDDLDSALLLIGQAEGVNRELKSDSLEARICYAYSLARREKGDREKGLGYIQRSVELYRKVGEPVALGNAYMEMGGYYGVDDSISSERRKASFAAALEQFRLAGGPKDRMADALKNLGEVNYIARNYAEARMELREALAIYKTIGKKDIQDVYDLLGSVSSDLGDSPAAIQYGLMAIKTAEAAGDTSIQLCTIYHRLGFSYNTARQADLAIPIEEKALAIALKYKDENAVFTVLANLCGELIGAGQIEKALKILQETERKLPLHDKWSRTVLEAWHLNALTRLRRFDEAKEHAAALNTFLKDPNQSHYLQPLAIYTALIRYYIALGQPQVANKYIVEDLAEARKDHPLWSAQAWWLKSQVDSALGNFAASLSDYKLFKAINDSLFTVSRNYILAQTQIEYETDKKDKDLRLKQKDIDLLTSNNQLQVVQLKKAAFTRNGIVLGALVLLGLAYTAYKVKKSHNQKLRVQQVAINHQNAQLRQLLEEKDWLIREIHHRVKNNLQIVISLLNTQCEFLENPSALNAIRESKERMQAIAMLHQKLYMAEDSEAVVNMRSYIDEMVIHLQDSYEAAARSIFFRKQVADVDLDVSQAVPIALLLNEAITNSVKHACSPHKRGTIDIALTQPSAGHILLRIADDGPGLPAGFQLEDCKSLGLKLIQLFSQQLKGELRFSSGGGLEITMLFKSRSVRKALLVTAN